MHARARTSCRLGQRVAEFHDRRRRSRPASAAAGTAAAASGAARRGPAAPARHDAFPRLRRRLLAVADPGRGAVLVTLGIYRFWLMTDVRRFLWSNTEIAGETLEYDGLATELLVGFLFAIAILIPIYAGIAMATLAFELPDCVGARRSGAVRRVRRLCPLPGPPLPADPHGVSRPAFPSGWIRLALRFVCHPVVVFDHRELWACLSVGAGEPATLHDAPYQLREIARPFDGAGWRLFLRGLPLWLVSLGPLLAAGGFALSQIDWQALGIGQADGPLRPTLPARSAPKRSSASASAGSA